jgi:hypothetical protein
MKRIAITVSVNAFMEGKNRIPLTLRDKILKCDEGLATVPLSNLVNHEGGV